MTPDQARAIARSISRTPGVRGAAVYDLRRRRVLAWRRLRWLGMRHHASDVIAAVELLARINAAVGVALDARSQPVRTPPLEILTLGTDGNHLLRLSGPIEHPDSAVLVICTGAPQALAAVRARLDVLLSTGPSGPSRRITGTLAGGTSAIDIPDLQRTNSRDAPARRDGRGRAETSRTDDEGRLALSGALPRREVGGIVRVSAIGADHPPSVERDPQILDRVLAGLRADTPPLHTPSEPWEPAEPRSPAEAPPRQPGTST